MSCSRHALVAMLVFGGCAGDDVPVTEINVIAMTPVTLAPPPVSGVPASLAHYRWELATAPAASIAAALDATSERISVTPDVRGVFVYDRLLTDNGSEVLENRIVLTATGIVPHAEISGPSAVRLGGMAALDASHSASPEHLPVSPAWRLVRRPMGSAATLPDARATIVTLAPDLAGTYEMELRVFDGELWSPPETWTITAAP